MYLSILSYPILSHPIPSHPILSYPIYLSICLSIYLILSYPILSILSESIYPSVCLSRYLSISSVYLSLSVCLSIYLSICKLENEAILQDILRFWTWQYQKRSKSATLPHFFSWQHQKRSNSARLLNVWTWQRQKSSNSARLLHFAKLTTSKRSSSTRLPQFLNLTTSKAKQFCETSSFLTTSITKQFCETSSIFEIDNIKDGTILRDFLQKWKVECSAHGLLPMRFAIFPLHLSKVLRIPRKIDARSYEVLHLSRKIILANRQIWCSKMQPLLGNQRPDLLTSLMNMSFVLRLPREMHLRR